MEENEEKKETRAEITEDLVKQLRELPKLIFNQKESLLQIQKTLDSTIYKQKMLSNKISKEINEAITEDGKKQFPNQKLRDIEFDRRAKDSEEYQIYKNDKRQLEVDMEEIKMTIDFLEKSNRNYRALAYLFAGEIR
jgi:hypothetical protein